MPALDTASFITIAPKSAADTSFKAPPNEPIAVLTALAITTSLIIQIPLYKIIRIVEFVKQLTQFNYTTLFLLINHKILYFYIYLKNSSIFIVLILK